MKVNTFVLLLFIFCLSKANESLGCNLCHSVIRNIKDFISDPERIKRAMQPVNYICGKFASKDFCNTFLFSALPIMLPNLLEMLDPENFCKFFQMCEYPHYIMDDNIAYRNRVLRDKPPEKNEKIEESNDKPLKILIMNDAHVDYEYQKGTIANCVGDLCCRNTTNTTHSGEPIMAGKWGYSGLCDLPPATLTSFLHEVIDVKQPDIIFWLGDNVDHNIYHAHDDDHIKAGIYITNVLKNSSYGARGKVYPLLGNHEVRPISQYDPTQKKNNASAWVFAHHAELWSHWLNDDSKASLKKYGRYTQMHPNSNLRIIAINSFIYDTLNSFLWANSTDPTNQLGWLEETLRIAEKNDERVFIIGHIPMSHVGTMKHWAYRYTVLIDRFSHIIKGQFFGHTHEDNFVIMKSKLDNQKVVGVSYDCPSLTSYGWMNPSFRMFFANPKTYDLLDFIQFRLYLDKANKNEDHAEWDIAYQFTKLYGVNNMSFPEFEKIDYKIKTDPNLWKRMVDLEFSEGNRGKQNIQQAGAREFYYCYYTSASFFELEKCTGGKYLGLAYTAGYTFAKILAPWKIKTYD